MQQVVLQYPGQDLTLTSVTATSSGATVNVFWDVAGATALALPFVVRARTVLFAVAGQITLVFADADGITRSIAVAVPSSGATTINLASTSANAPVSQLDARYAPITQKRWLDTARWSLLKPNVMASPPTVTAGAANGATAIASSVLVTSLTPGAFTYYGGPTKRSASYPDYTGLGVGVYPQITSNAPMGIEFLYDTVDATGRIEIGTKGATASAGGYRVAVLNTSTGRWEYISAASTFTHPGDGNPYLDLVTLGAAGRYSLRLEMPGGATFNGVRCGPTDTVSAINTRRKRYIVVGDSFSEPTVTDSGAATIADGWPIILSHMTGLDIWCAGSGGTGYLSVNGGLSRPKFRDRLAADILAFNPDGIIWAGGINDYPNFTAAAIGAEAALCFAQVTAYNPNIDQVVLPPFYPKTATTSTPTNLFAARDALKAAAIAAGARFLDILSLPALDWTGSWSSALTASISASGTSFTVPALPAYIAAAVGVGATDQWYVYVGTGATAEVRAVGNISGTAGAYVCGLANSATFTFAHSISEPVTVAGPQYMTGVGRQGSTTGVGNADRYTGSDSTHPTVAGHAYLAFTVAELWARSIRLAP